MGLEHGGSSLEKTSDVGESVGIRFKLRRSGNMLRVAELLDAVVSGKHDRTTAELSLKKRHHLYGIFHFRG